MGGTILGASRAYVNPDDPEELSLILDRLCTACGSMV